MESHLSRLPLDFLHSFLEALVEVLSLASILFNILVLMEWPSEGIKNQAQALEGAMRSRSLQVPSLILTNPAPNYEDEFSVSFAGALISHASLQVDHSCQEEVESRSLPICFRIPN